MSRPVRRPSPTLYLVLGVMWAVFAVAWAASGDVVVMVLFALLAAANLGMGAWLRRKQRGSGVTGR